jgi:hypothetical protein
MPIRISRGQSDSVIELYRLNPVSVRVRIIDSDFAGRDRVERSRDVWRYLDVLPEDFVADLSSLILLTPDEVLRSFANMEFEDPVLSEV